MPIRNKKTLALVAASVRAELAKTEVKKMSFNLRKVAEDKGPSVFADEFLEAVRETAKYFAVSDSAALSALIPNVFVEAYDKISKINSETAGAFENMFNNLISEKLLFQYPLADRLSVYKTLVRESFARGKSIFIVLPTEQDITNFGAALAKGVEQFTFSLHSGLSAKKNLKSFEKLMFSSHPALILATPPFLSMPLRSVGTIILERETSNAYRTIKKPYLDLRIFAEIYAAKIGAKFILGGDLLRFETIARQELEHLHTLHPLSFRIDFSGEIEVVARIKKERGSPFRIFSKENLQEIERALERKKNVFIFSLRKGLATETVCRDCGDTLLCADCASPLVLYVSSARKKRIFVCNRCERDWGTEKTCARCGSWNLTPLGIGTDTVYEEIKKTFPGAAIYKLDKESAKSASGAKKICKEFESESGAILIGTEMAFFYLKKKVPFSIIAAFETLWSVPSFRMSEKILQIGVKMAEVTSEKILVTTKNTRDSVILAIASGNLLQFIREELADRQKLGYPPYARFIKISHLGDKEEKEKARKFLSEFFEGYQPEIFSGFVARLKGKYATNALIKIDPKRWSLPALSLNSQIDENLHQKLTSLPPNFEVSVDPEDLL